MIPIEKRWEKKVPRGNDHPQRETPWWFANIDDQELDYPPTVMVGHRYPSSHRPVTALQALMETAPFGVPEDSYEELEGIGDALAVAVDGLSHPERYVLEQTVIAKRSLRDFTYGEMFDLGPRKAARRIPKTTVARWRDAAIDKLRDQLVDDPEVKSYLDRST